MGRSKKIRRRPGKHAELLRIHAKRISIMVIAQSRVMGKSPNMFNKRHPQGHQLTNHYANSKQHSTQKPFAATGIHRKIYNKPTNPRGETPLQEINMPKKKNETKINLQHITIDPKYRRNVLTHKVADECYYLIKDICRKHGIIVHEIAIQGDHVHLFIQIPHTMAVCKAAQLIKWYTSLRLRSIFPFLKKASYVNEKHFWSENYWSRSIGGDASKVKKYIEKQMHNIERKTA